MTYSYPANMTGLESYFNWVNNIIQINGEGIFMTSFLLVLWLIIFSVSIKLTDSTRSATGASFVVFIATMLLFITGLVGYSSLIVSVVALGVCGVLVKIKG